jgi:hypothetical protein
VNKAKINEKHLPFRIKGRYEDESICANPIKSVKSVTRRKLISYKPLDKFL